MSETGQISTKENVELTIEDYKSKLVEMHRRAQRAESELARIGSYNKKYIQAIIEKEKAENAAWDALSCLIIYKKVTKLKTKTLTWGIRFAEKYYKGPVYTKLVDIRNDRFDNTSLWKKIKIKLGFNI